MIVDNARLDSAGQGTGALLDSGPFESPVGSSLSVTVDFWHYLDPSQTTLQMGQYQLQTGAVEVEFELTPLPTSPTAKIWRNEKVAFCLNTRKLTQIGFQATPGPLFTFAGLDEVITYRSTGH